jgi:endonuclease-3
MKREIRKIDNRLLKRYGIPPRKDTPPDPLNILIGTILSQNTNDANSYRAYQNLLSKYNSWDEIAEAERADIEDTIRTAGLGKQKSNAIKKALQYLKQKNDTISLEHLKKENDESALRELVRMEGVGIKTASCVLLFSLRRNICPVDTHVHRVLNRVGVVVSGSPDKTFLLINKHLPEGIAHRFHTNLILLGREYCKPSNPGCPDCPLLDICAYEDKSASVQGKSTKKNTFLLLDSI